MYRRVLLLFFIGLLAWGSAFAQEETPPEPAQTEGAAAEQPAVDAEPETEDEAPAEPETEETEAAPAPAEPAIADYTPEQLETALQNVRNQITEAEGAQAGTPETPSERISALRDLENAIQRRISTNKRLEETRTAVAEADGRAETFASEGLEAAAPYKVSFLDQLRDELGAQRREAETDALAAETSDSLLTQATERLNQVEQRRREIRDELERAADDAARAEIQGRLDVAQIHQRAAEHHRANAVRQAELAQLEKELTDKRVALLEKKVAAAEAEVVFSESELEDVLSELQARQERLQQQSRELQRSDAANQSRLAEARDNLAQARGESEIRVRTEALAAREAWAQTSSRGVELVQQRIENVAREKTLWERRYELYQGADAAGLATWARETETVLDETERRRRETERRLQDLRATKLEIQNRISQTDTPAEVKTELESRVRALERREEYASAYLSSLLGLESLAQRLLGQIERERSVDSWGAIWSRIQLFVDEWWNREVFVIDDRAFRVGALTRSAVLFSVLLCIAFVIRFVLRRTVLRPFGKFAKTTRTWIDDNLVKVLGSTHTWIVVLLAFYLSVRTLPVSEQTAKWLDGAAIIAVWFQVATWGTVALTSWLERVQKRRVVEDPSSVSAFGVMKFFGQVAIWAVVLLIALQNLTVEITPLIAGLGVGGVAIAFALQNILGDVFCSIAILLDKPFVVGDFIIVGDLLGSVEHIGIKTTRLRSLGGEQIVFSNADLLASRIRNYKRMYERRVMFKFGVVYETKVDDIEAIPKIVREIIENIERTRFDRAHFQSYGDFSLVYEVVYYVLDPDYNLYMDIQEKINIGMFRAFQERGVKFAYPTQEMIIRGNGVAPVSALTAGEQAPQTSGPE